MEWGAKRRRTGGNDATAGGASSTHTSTEGQEGAGYDYEVFLSFRGLDTRAGFTDFLYTSLIGAGIRTFKDDEHLRKGVEFAPKLLQAIKQSKILIPIFSKDYASSFWCLKEVVQMVECKKNGGKMIMPIFYDVAPSEVRNQIGSYEEPFRLHERKKRYDQKTIGEWKDALRAVGEINGWELPRELTSRREGKFVKKFTQKIFNELKKASLVVSNNLVGVDDHVDEIMEMIGAWTSKKRIIGISGMGGIGKTTIAKIIYNKLLEKFDYCCFLSNIREMSENKGIECLQNQLISDILKEKWENIRNFDEGTKTIRGMLCEKKVLILLDDVDRNRHMDALVGNRDWFGKGSKLIITTRNKEVLNVREVDDIYEVDVMDLDQSLQLFSKHAFRRDYPLDKDINQSMTAIKIAGGLPLALEVMGSFLSRIEKEKWDYNLAKLERLPHGDVRSKLKISYDVLENREKYIFLDIACFLIGNDKDIIVHFWESKFHSERAMDVLESMSLIKIKEDNKVWMHDQLRDLGREIVQSELKIEKQSRVWDPKEALGLLRRQKKKEKLEALRLQLDHLDHQHCLTYGDFKRLPNLRFLEVCSSKETFCAEERLLWHELPSNVLPINVCEENSYLLPQLRWLSWHDIPPLFKIANFSMNDVVILDLSRSEITHDWKGWSHLEVMKQLKIMNLSYCQSLKRTPNFSAHSNLERLILSNCESLIKIDTSICQLKQLVYLDVSKCQNLGKLPKKLGGDLASLEYLSLNYCRSLTRLPNSIGNLKSLIELHIIHTMIKELPDSIRNLKNLKVVKMWYNVPEVLWTIEKLEEIECHEVRNGILVKISDCIYRNESLRILKLVDAKINVLPMLPKSLIELELSLLYMDMDMFPNLSNLTNLKVLELWFGPPCYEDISSGPVEVFMPRWIGNLSSLQSLDLSSPYVTTSPTDLTFPPRLKSLRLRCRNLRRLPRLPSSLSSLDLPHCNSLCSVEDLLNLKKLSYLHINNAAITDIQGLGCLENLRSLWLFRLQKVKILSDLSNINKLRTLRIEWCDELVEIQGKLPESLEELHIKECKSLQELPDLSNLNGLQELNISLCKKLDVEAIYRSCSVVFSGSSSEGEDDE